MKVLSEPIKILPRKSTRELVSFWAINSLALLQGTWRQVNKCWSGDCLCCMRKDRFLRGKLSAQEPQDQVLSTKEIYLSQRDRGQG